MWDWESETEGAQAPPNTATSPRRNATNAEDVFSTSVHVNPHIDAVEAARAASSAPRGTAHAERDHKNGGATPRARIAARNAGWCMTMAFTKLMHDLEAHGRQKGLPFAISPRSPGREGVPLFHCKSRSAATRHVNPRKARSYRVERWPLAFLRQNESLAHHRHTLKREPCSQRLLAVL